MSRYFLQTFWCALHYIYCNVIKYSVGGYSASVGAGARRHHRRKKCRRLAGAANRLSTPVVARRALCRCSLRAPTIPAASAAFTSAPRERSSLTAGSCPLREARCSGVLCSCWPSVGVGGIMRVGRGGW